MEGAERRMEREGGGKCGEGNRGKPWGGHRGHRRESGLCQSDTENHWSVLGRQMTQSDLYL